MKDLVLILRGFWRVSSFRSGVVFLLATVAAATISYVYFLTPAQLRFRTLKTATVALQNESADLEARANQISNFAELQAQLGDIRTRFSAQVERSGTVERMVQMSGAAGTRIIHGSNSFAAAKSGVVPVHQDLTVEGAYDQVRDFLNRLAAIETLTILRSAAFTSNQDGTLVRVKMRLVTYAKDTGR